jgi:hypothetical protein
MNLLNLRFSVFSAMILAAALSRLLPHPPNFAPITAMALFAGATMTDKRWAFAVPLAAMLLSDTILELTTGWGFHSGMWVVYAAFCLVTLLGIQIRAAVNAGRVALATFAGSVLFFVLTNLAVWASGGMYPRTLAGLEMCFVAALPFFQNSLMGDAFYATLLFGGFALAERNLPAMRASAEPSSR